jgi:hypothetical protein
VNTDRIARTSLLVVCAVIIVGSGPQAFGQTTRRESSIIPAGAPEWYERVPTDSTGLIARGTGKSKDQQVAIDKAIAGARRTLAIWVNRRWRALVEAIAKESGLHADVNTKSITLIASTVLKQSAVKRGKLWTAFVLVFLPESSIRRALDRRLHENAEWFSQIQGTKTAIEFEASAR